MKKLIACCLMCLMCSTVVLADDADRIAQLESESSVLRELISTLDEQYINIGPFCMRVPDGWEFAEDNDTYYLQHDYTLVMIRSLEADGVPAISWKMYKSLADSWEYYDNYELISAEDGTIKGHDYHMDDITYTDEDGDTAYLTIVSINNPPHIGYFVRQSFQTEDSDNLEQFFDMVNNVMIF